MGTFIICFGQIVLYTLGVIVVCGLAVEVCYRLCFALMGRRTGRVFWFATSWLGTPVHEAGHALMCLLFAHRIEKIRLIPTRRGGAVVEHSYDRSNVYATLGNLFIGLGPIVTGLGVIIAVLCLVYPNAMQGYLGEQADFFGRVWRLCCGLLTEQTHAIWVRILALALLFSVTLHVRLSASDVRGMLHGLPGYLILCALAAVVVAIVGGETPSRVAQSLRSFAGVVAGLFGLILLFAVIQLAVVAVYRLVVALLAPLRGGK